MFLRLFSVFYIVVIICCALTSFITHTLLFQSFLSDDEPSIVTDPYNSETPWAATEQLVGNTQQAKEEGGESHSFVIRNSGFDDVSLDTGNEDRHGNELSERSWQKSKVNASGSVTSPL